MKKWCFSLMMLLFLPRPASAQENNFIVGYHDSTHTDVSHSSGSEYCPQCSTLLGVKDLYRGRYINDRTSPLHNTPVTVICEATLIYGRGVGRPPALPDTVGVLSYFDKKYHWFLIPSSKLMTGAEKIRYDEATRDEQLREMERAEQGKAEQRAKKRLQTLTTKYGKTTGTRLANGEIWLGMTKEMAIDSRGQPDDSNRSVGPWGVHEQWVYPRGVYLYFENGKLASWQD